MMIDFDILWPKWGIIPTGVLHIGANEGQEAATYYNHNVKEVIWVEAIPEVFEKLNDHVKDIPGTVCINACVSDKDGEEVEFNISNNEAQSSSMLEFGHHLEIHPTVQYIDKIKLKTHRIDTLLKGVSLKGDWFLNIDVQGAELLALKGMGSLLHKFKWAYLEVNKIDTYIGCGLVGDIDDYLHEYGFKRVETGDWVADSWTDALYCKL